MEAESGRPPTPDGAASHREQLRHMTDAEVRAYEMKVTNVLVDHPLKLMCCCTVLFFILCFVSFGMIGFKISETSFEDKHDIRTERHESATVLRDLIENQPSGEPAAVSVRGPRQLMRSVPLASFTLVYDGKGGDVLTLERIRFIKETEDRILVHPDYKHFCILQRLNPVNGTPAACPGVDCPLSRTQWEYATTKPMPGDVKAVCKAPELSFSWLMWNFRVAVNNKECNVETDFQTCVDTGRPVHMVALDDGRTMADRLNTVELGGVEPTQKEIDAMVRVLERLIRNRDPQFGYMGYFFDKNFGRDDLPASERFHSKFVRSDLGLGGPMPLTDPTGHGTPCHERDTEAACVKGSSGDHTHCSWVDWAGPNRNLQGCVVTQYFEVSRDREAVTNEDQKKESGKWFSKPITNDLDDLDGPVDVLYMADGTLFDKFNEILIRDSLLAMIAFFFVYLYLQIHTGSFMLASLGMLQVIMPFPLAYFVYYSIFGIKNFYGLSTLTLFIVLAIGADDIFVFMDSWVQAGDKPRNDTCTYLKGRFTHAWKISATAMGITSLTTMSAFIATMSTPLDEVAFFGAFAALLVMFDYILVMTFFACSVVVYHRYSEYTLGCCCCGAQALGAWFNCCTCYTTMLDNEADHPGCMESKMTEARTYETLEEARDALGPQLDFSPRKAHHHHKANPEDEKHLLAGDPEYKRRRIAGFVMLGVAFVLYAAGFAMLFGLHSSEPKKFMTWIVVILLGLILFCAAMNAFRAAGDRIKQLGLSLTHDGFFRTTLGPFLSGKSGPGRNTFVRLLPAIIMVGVWGWLVSEASTLSPTTKTEQWLPDWHPIQRLFLAMSDEFASSERVFVQEVFVTIGVDANNPLDRSNWDRWNVSSKGEVNLVTDRNKYALYSTEEFQKFVLAFCDDILKQSVDSNKKLQRTNVLNPASRDQNCFMRGFKDYAIMKGKTFPVPQAEYVGLLWEYVQYEETLVHQNGTYLYPSDVHQDKVLFNFPDPEAPPTGVEAMVLTFNTTLKRRGNSNSLLRDWYDEWQDNLDKVIDGEPQWITDIYGATFPLQGHIMQSSGAWVWMHTQSVLVKGAINGTAMSLGLAAIVVFFGTLNVWISVLVLLELFGVVGYVLGMMSLIGWELGTIESVAVTILVGLSVDYVVHLAVHYTHCHVDGSDGDVTERQQRVFATAVEMGPTVLGGAATSVGTALVLLLTWVQFFYKFGICFLLTILFSYIWSMFFFLPLMSVVGPQNEFLSIRPLLERCLPKFFAPAPRVGTLEVPTEMEAKVLPASAVTLGPGATPTGQGMLGSPSYGLAGPHQGQPVYTAPQLYPTFQNQHQNHRQHQQFPTHTYSPPQSPTSGRL
eukprot:TRINITY_DN153_c0_g1_i4.p1 TRINITY_DN153_c0_g1~~TRINITY_DN153_c0_g1_i4.p1  ORF type:complete len:1387 (+),score=607.30 TRINITY_DN153_c0_g1_i4:112-4161(+)